MWTRRKQIIYSTPLWVTLYLIFLKLTGFVSWSWAWVLAPMWVVFGVAFAIWLPLVAYLFFKILLFDNWLGMKGR